MQLTKSYEFIQSTWEDPHPEKKPSYHPIIKLFQIGFGIMGRIAPNYAAQQAYRLFTSPRRKAKHNFSDEVLESAKIFEFMYARQILKGYQWGDGERTVLLVHGWESRGTAMRSFVPRLLQAGFKVIAIDGPAHGNSGGRRTNLSHFGGAVNAILNHIGPVYGIIAHSFGGMATTYALRHLDQKHEVEKLVFVGVPSRTVQGPKSYLRMLKMPARATDAFLRILIEKTGNLPPEDLNVATSEKHVNVQKLLVVHDKKDAVVPFKAAKDIFDNWDNADLIATEAYGHFRIMKNPDVLDRVTWFMHE